MIRASLWAVAVIAAGVPSGHAYGGSRRPRHCRWASGWLPPPAKQCWPGFGWLDPGLFDLAAGDLVVGAQAQPGSKMLHRGPFAHIGADFAQHFLDGQFIHPIDLGQIDATSGDRGLEPDQNEPGSCAVFFGAGSGGGVPGSSGGSNSWYMASSSASQACTWWS